jgi:uncharacterized protein YndB with AHSA1/START domain
MADIRHRVGITASREQVYQALATTEGLSRWWTRDTAGDPAVGGKLEFYFGQAEPGGVMEVTELGPGQRVAWRCVQGPDEWVGTAVTFSLSQTGDGPGGETVVLFTHAGWREPAEFMHHCSTKWAYFLLGLKAGLEGGSATPYPADMAISSWG